MDIETRSGHVDMELKYWGILKFYEKIKRKTGSPNCLSQSDYRLLIMHEGVCHFSVCWRRETNGSYPFANRLN
jgi:hypothetical protein